MARTAVDQMNTLGFVTSGTSSTLISGTAQILVLGGAASFTTSTSSGLTQYTITYGATGSTSANPTGLLVPIATLPLPGATTSSTTVLYPVTVYVDPDGISPLVSGTLTTVVQPMYATLGTGAIQTGSSANVFYEMSATVSYHFYKTDYTVTMSSAHSP